jgi:hypothetical protein
VLIAVYYYMSFTELLDVVRAVAVIIHNHRYIRMVLKNLLACSIHSMFSFCLVCVGSKDYNYAILITVYH